MHEREREPDRERRKARMRLSCGGAEDDRHEEGGRITISMIAQASRL